MKNINRFLRILTLIVLVIFSSCDSFDLDLTNDPNFLTPEQADVDFFLSSIQEDFVRQIEGDADYDINDNWSSGGATLGDGLSLFGAELTRVYCLSNTASAQYNSAYQGSDSDDEWTNAYVGIFADIKAMMPLAEENGLVRHIGIAQFVEAYVLTAMVDFYGDIPYTEAVLGSDNLNPKLDDGASIYEAALSLLDDAIANFQADAAVLPAIDLYYNNDYEKWIKAANTLKMRLYLQRRLVDQNAISSINSIISSGNYISSTDDDFQFEWPATSPTGPDTRHPRYGINYTPTGGNDYMSNWMMNLMMTTSDPRIRYYYYRQTPAVPGAEIDPDEQLLQCSLQSPPAHYVAGGFTFCFLNNGYWGRDHGDTDGIPPDGLVRTTFGVYPAGGKFDDDSFTPITSGVGGGGNGITPILTAAWVDFMRAEIAMVEGNTNDAKTFMLAGLEKSIAKVQTFSSKDIGADLSYEPTETDVNDFIDFIGSVFDGADMEGKWDVLAEQFFVTVFGNGIESYNFYRRTGYPTTLQPNLDPNPGTFIRSMFYPARAVNTNSNITQKPDQAQPVFWDTNGVPPAN
ncbi:SusD/RagB family nutrient-binding outer membrane lipoprotein [Draconibacterium sp.]|nr:SusD/RagB family nutrient-binding outer membrane lipoprotein [Draconibacterium sp.]